MLKSLSSFLTEWIKISTANFSTANKLSAVAIEDQYYKGAIFTYWRSQRLFQSYYFPYFVVRVKFFQTHCITFSCMNGHRGIVNFFFGGGGSGFNLVWECRKVFWLNRLKKAHENHLPKGNTAISFQSSKKGHHFLNLGSGGCTYLGCPPVPSSLKEIMFCS